MINLLIVLCLFITQGTASEKYPYETYLDPECEHILSVRHKEDAYVIIKPSNVLLQRCSDEYFNNHQGHENTSYEEHVLMNLGWEYEPVEKVFKPAHVQEKWGSGNKDRKIGSRTYYYCFKRDSKFPTPVGYMIVSEYPYRQDYVQDWLELNDTLKTCREIFAWVHPNYRARGIGRPIGEALMNYFQSADPDSCYLSVVPKNNKISLLQAQKRPHVVFISCNDSHFYFVYNLAPLLLLKDFVSSQKYKEQTEKAKKLLMLESEKIRRDLLRSQTPFDIKASLVDLFTFCVRYAKIFNEWVLENQG